MSSYLKGLLDRMREDRKVVEEFNQSRRDNPFDVRGHRREDAGEMWAGLRKTGEDLWQQFTQRTEKPTPPYTPLQTDPMQETNWLTQPNVASLRQKQMARQDTTTDNDLFQTIGRNKNTMALLRGMGASDEDFNTIFGNAPIPSLKGIDIGTTGSDIGKRQPLPVEQAPSIVEQPSGAVSGMVTPGRQTPKTLTEGAPSTDVEKWKNIWNTAGESFGNLYRQTAGAFTDTFPKLLFPTDENTLAGQRLSPEERTKNKETVDSLEKLYVKSEQEHQNWLAQHPEFEPLPEFQGNILEQMQGRPRDIGYIILNALAQGLPGTLALIGGTVASVGTGNPMPLLGAIAILTPAQIQENNRLLLANGAKPEQAAALGTAVGVVSNAIMFLPAGKVLKGLSPMAAGLFRKTATEEVARLAAQSALKQGLKQFGETEALFTVFGVAQQGIQNAAVKLVNQKQDIFAGLSESAASSLIGGLPLSVFGAGGKMINAGKPEAVAGGIKSAGRTLKEAAVGEAGQLGKPEVPTPVTPAGKAKPQPLVSEAVKTPQVETPVKPVEKPISPFKQPPGRHEVPSFEEMPPDVFKSGAFITPTAKGDVGQAVRVGLRQAKRTGKDVYAFPTADGMKLGNKPPPFGVQHIVLRPDGTHEVIQARGFSRPVSPEIPAKAKIQGRERLTETEMWEKGAMAERERHARVVTPSVEAPIPPKQPIAEVPPVEAPIKPTQPAGEPPIKPPEKPPKKPTAVGTQEVPPMKSVIPPKDIIPTEPIVKSNGKLWLPEPPREIKPYIDYARKEVSGSFRKKQGVFDTVEQARQQVLKARDMGDNVVPYVESYIRQVGDLTKEFGMDIQGIVSKVGNPEGRSLAINDVLSNYTHYTLTPVQIEIAKRHGFVYEEALKLAKSYGVKISELPPVDEAWQYIARKVKGKLNPLTGEYDMPAIPIGGFKMGAKISAQKERQFSEMFQGVDLGFLYEHPDQVMAQHIKGIYRLIGNKQAENTVMPLLRDVTKKTPLKFGERVVSEPALQGKVAVTELANAIDKIYAVETVPSGLRRTADVSGAMVGQIAALDISAPFIQGIPILGHDLKMGLQGKRSAVWAQSYGKMWQTVKNPESINAFRTANHDLYKQAIESGILTGQSEFVSGVSTAQTVLGKIPKAGGTIREAYRQSWGRMGQAYSDFLEIARIKMFEQMAPVWTREGKNLYELGAVINRMTGTVSASARGIGQNRRAIERIAAFAPNYLRSSLLMLKDLGTRGATAREVQASIAALLGVGATVYFAEEKLRGKEPKMKPWATKWGGDGSAAYTIEVGDTRVGIGSWMYAMIKALADVGAMAIDNPGELVVFNDQHPLMRLAKGKRGPAISLAVELATGRNFFGQKFTGVNDYLMRIVESLIPISAQSLVTQEPRGGVEQVGAELMGLRAYPTLTKRVNQIVTDITSKLGQEDTESLNKRITQAETPEMKMYIQERGDIVSTSDLAAKLSESTRYFTLGDMPEGKFEPIVYAFKKAEEGFSRYEGVRPDKRDDFRRDNPTIDAQLFFWGKVTTTKTAEAREIAERMVREYGIPENAVPGLREKTSTGGSVTPKGFSLPAGLKTRSKSSLPNPFLPAKKKAYPNPFIKR